MFSSQSCIATYRSVPPQLPPVPEEVNMLRSIPPQVETRSQLVPNPGSPLSLENWSLADLDNWITESASLMTKGAYKPITIDTSPQQQQYQQQKMAAYHNSVHVTIPSPSSSTGAADSPTMYDNSPGGKVAYMGGPPPYVHVKQEIDDGDYQCSGGGVHMASPMEGSIKREEDAIMQQVEELRRMACESAAKDITVACDLLGISPDPAMWSVADVNTWVLWILNQYNLNTDLLHHFIGIDGITLCNLGDVFFRQKLPSGGDMLCAQLDIWKTAASMQRQSQIQQQTQQLQQQQQLGFRPEESMLDMSGILDQWTPYPAQQQQHRMSPPAGSGGVAPLPVAPDSSVASPVGSTQDFSSDGMQSDDEISDESCDAERCGPAPVGARPSGRPGSHSHIHLWQFLKELLCQPHLFGSCIRWLDRPKGIFKIEDSVRVARLWGKRKNRPAMNYDKLSRSIRQYYKKGIMKKTERSQRLVYQFCHPYGL